jgi:hypothetical protein
VIQQINPKNTVSYLPSSIGKFRPTANVYPGSRGVSKHKKERKGFERKQPPTHKLDLEDRNKSIFVQFPCTVCKTILSRFYDWKSHEKEKHERDEEWACKDCSKPNKPLVFFNKCEFIRHHRDDHGCDDCKLHLLKKCGKSRNVRSKICIGCNHADESHSIVRESKAYGCGFCSKEYKSFSSWNDRCRHIHDHFEKGAEIHEWQFSNVIMALIYGNRKLNALFWDQVSNIHGPQLENTPVFNWDRDQPGSERLLHDLQCLQNEDDIFWLTELAENAYNQSQKVPVDRINPAYSPPSPATSPTIENSLLDLPLEPFSVGDHNIEGFISGINEPLHQGFLNHASVVSDPGTSGYSSFHLEKYSYGVPFLP